jgi:hypothetical protein
LAERRARQSIRAAIVNTVVMAVTSERGESSRITGKDAARPAWVPPLVADFDAHSRILTTETTEIAEKRHKLPISAVSVSSVVKSVIIRGNPPNPRVSVAHLLCVDTVYGDG